MMWFMVTCTYYVDKNMKSLATMKDLLKKIKWKVIVINGVERKARIRQPIKQDTWVLFHRVAEARVYLVGEILVPHEGDREESCNWSMCTFHPFLKLEWKHKSLSGTMGLLHTVPLVCPMFVCTACLRYDPPVSLQWHTLWICWHCSLLASSPGPLRGGGERAWYTLFAHAQLP